MTFLSNMIVFMFELQTVQYTYEIGFLYVLSVNDAYYSLGMYNTFRY